MTRRREDVEILIELYMERYNGDPRSDRQWASLERKIDAQRTKVLTGYPDLVTHDEFRMLVCVIAYRRGILTPERWAEMRRLAYSGDKTIVLRDHFRDIMGRPLSDEQRSKHYSPASIHVDTLRPELPTLRKMFDDPNWRPSARREESRQESEATEDENPEQIAHPDQDRIDRIAAEVLAEIDL